jgi:uncharacterized membrane protein
MLNRLERVSARVDMGAEFSEKGHNMPMSHFKGRRMRLPLAGSRIGCAMLALFGAAAALTAFGTSTARADFRVCNGTQGLVGVAIGYRAEAGWVTEGWWHIAGSSCKTLIEGPLSSRYFYLYAEDAEKGGRWDGPINMCVAEKEFKINGVNDCFARGFQRAGFQEYDTGEQASWMVQLSGDAAGGDAAGGEATPDAETPPAEAPPAGTPPAEPSPAASTPDNEPAPSGDAAPTGTENQ